jgi:hypothetical protein
LLILGIFCKTALIIEAYQHGRIAVIMSSEAITFSLLVVLFTPLSGELIFKDKLNALQTLQL